MLVPLPTQIDYTGTHLPIHPNLSAFTHGVVDVITVGIEKNAIEGLSAKMVSREGRCFDGLTWLELHRLTR